MPKLKEILFGKKSKIKQTPTTSPMQQQLLELIRQGLESGEGPLSDLFGGFNEENFQKGVAEPELNMFKNEILPLLRERFIAGNQTGGSGFYNAQAKAGTELSDKIARLKYEAQNEQQKNRLSGINSLMGNQVQNFYQQGDKGLVQGALQGAANKALSVVAG